MLILGFQKLTLLDYPGHVACIVFTGGCNFRCPFCHNASLVHATADRIDAQEILAYLKKRRSLLDGVTVTGGEPLLQPDLAAFLRQIKEMGYDVKLDTNGSYPDRLASLICEGLVDYVAMDIKNSPAAYAKTAGIRQDSLDNVQRSIELLLGGSVDYEFRTTVTAELHTVDDIAAIAASISGAKRYFLQNFVDSGDILSGGMTPVPKDTLQKMCDAAVAAGVPTQTR